MHPAKITMLPKSIFNDDLSLSPQDLMKDLSVISVHVFKDIFKMLKEEFKKKIKKL